MIILANLKDRDYKIAGGVWDGESLGETLPKEEFIEFFGDRYSQREEKIIINFHQTKLDNLGGE